MRIARIADLNMSPLMRSAVATYRYRVFVQSLQWQLPCANGHEQDEFDTACATHFLAYNDDQELVGYARLLPTTQPYLLATHFAHLFNGAEPPHSPFIWELSRFAASDVVTHAHVGKRLLLEVVRFVLTKDCDKLLFCTTVGIERLAHRWGVDICRIGAPHRSDGGLLVAATIACNEKSISALAGTAPCVERRAHFGKHAGVPVQGERDIFSGGVER